MPVSKRLQVALISGSFPTQEAMIAGKCSVSKGTLKKFDDTAEFNRPLVGGAERQICSLAPFLNKSGIDLMVYSKHWDKLVSRRDVVSGIPVYRSASPPPSSFGSILFTANTLKSLIRLKPDVVHVLGLLSPANIALINKLLSGTPVVVKLMSSGKVNGDIERLKQKKLGSIRLNYLRNYVDAFVTISSDLTEELNAIKVAPQKQYFIPNGVDTNHFRPLKKLEEKIELRKRLGIPANDIILIYTGRLVPHKCIDQLLSVWPFIKQKFGNVSLVVVGAGRSAPALKKLASDGVYLIGSVGNVSPYLQASDVFVSPSSSEGLSNSLLEAMSCGLPVLATAVGGTRDVVNNGEQGLLIKPNDPYRLKDALHVLLSDLNKLPKLGLSARNKILQDYSIISTARKLEDLYYQLYSRKLC